MSADGQSTRSVAVIPDAWFELAIGSKKPVAIAIELDRGSEDQKRWRAKVEALAAWALGPYREAFGNETLTIAVVTPDEPRRDQLRTWTAQELSRIGQSELAEIFLHQRRSGGDLPAKILLRTVLVRTGPLACSFLQCCRSRRCSR